MSTSRARRQEVWGTVRIRIDLTKLNKFVKRPLHPLATHREAVLQVSDGVRFFSTLASRVSGHEIRLLATVSAPPQPAPDDPDDITGLDLKFLRSPMGLVSTGDDYCRRGDFVLRGLENFVKVVDDILVYSETLKEHKRHLRALLDRCREHWIPFNAQKFFCAAD